MEGFQKVAVLGAGSFGTAVANHIAGVADGEVVIYGRDPDVVKAIDEDHVNLEHLEGHELSEDLQATGSAGEALEGADLVVLGVPAQHLRGLLEEVKGELPEQVPLLDLAKGIEQGTNRRMSQVIHDVLGKKWPVASLSGPSFAKDVVSGRPVGVTIGSRDRRLMRRLRSFLNTAEFDVKLTSDLAGVEVGGALKNVFAVVAGVFTGCELGDSIPGDYFTRSMVEMRDVGMYLGGRWATFSGRSGLGDLVITCSPSSRNFRFGCTYAEVFAGSDEADHERVFEETIDRLGTRTVEGYDTIRAVHDIVERKRMFTPIITGVHRLLYEHAVTPDQLLGDIRRMDLPRQKEGPHLYSIVMHQLLPRFWYRHR